jgi:hypothetical protein
MIPFESPGKQEFGFLWLYGLCCICWVQEMDLISGMICSEIWPSRHKTTDSQIQQAPAHTQETLLTHYTTLETNKQSDNVNNTKYCMHVPHPLSKTPHRLIALFFPTPPLFTSQSPRINKARPLRSRKSPSLRSLASQKPLTHAPLPRNTALPLRDLDPIFLCSGPRSHATAHPTRTGIMSNMPHATRQTPHTLAPAKALLTSQTFQPLNFPLKSQRLGRLFFCCSLGASSRKASLRLRNLQLVDCLKQLLDLVSPARDVLLQLRIRFFSPLNLQL